MSSQGGQEPWRQERPRAEVKRLLGRGRVSLRFEVRRASSLRTQTEGDATFESARSLPCDVLPEDAHGQ
ncbi:hypothetical protein [Myxococcus sp. Y35]|uniref:hypothetical protein n=1 Tax=Pseudomyxococcus flavus TaxID=3115648 RepID=UPI003CEFEBB8